MVDGIYQFNNDRESTVCRVKLLQCLEPMPIIHYPQISKSQRPSTIYMPVSNGNIRQVTVQLPRSTGKRGKVHRYTALHIPRSLVVSLNRLLFRGRMSAKQQLREVFSSLRSLLGQKECCPSKMNDKSIITFTQLGRTWKLTVVSS